MIKIVPDPPIPSSSITSTAQKPFGTLDSTGQPLFCVRAGIPADDALIHVGMLLGCAEATAWDVVEHLQLNDKGVVLGLIQTIEMARALVDALVDGAAGP
ncbi:DUF6124 family protein [Pseudomonas akapageensis]|uniref:DUF6124 family protein n=1 Tax=Pseudomonas akapageensis TaxID=2609961 RepID=UPI001408C2EC|nr:DUF3077 domain-containing protein [Pseudomonas akapageensis]